MDSAATNYPGTLRDQNKYAPFDILANPNATSGWMDVKDLFVFTHLPQIVKYNCKIIV